MSHVNVTVNFYENLVNNLRKVLYNEALYESNSEADRIKFIEEKMQSISRIRLYGFCISLENKKSCELLLENNDFSVLVTLVRKFHIATDYVLEDVDLMTLKWMLLSSLYPERKLTNKSRLWKN